MTLDEIRAADNRRISVAEIRALLAKITPGPWAYSANVNRFFSTGLFGSRTIDPSVSDNYANAGMQVMDVVRNTIRPDDAAFIAAAPEIAKFAVEMAEYSARVRKMFDTTRWQITDALGVDRSQSWFSVRSLVTELREENEKLRAELEVTKQANFFQRSPEFFAALDLVRQENQELRAEVERLQGIETAAREVLDNPHSIDFYLSELSEVMDK